MAIKKKYKGLFLGSLLPTTEKPEGGIFYYKLIYKLQNYLEKIYIIYPQKINFKILSNPKKSIYGFTSIFLRPYFLSLGFLRYFKSIYKYINLICFFTFYLAIKIFIFFNFDNIKFSG